MVDNKVSIPSGMGGLVRYFDDYKSKIEFKPEHLTILIVIVVIGEILLHLL
mgnify:CR=1 FL=1